MKILLIGREGQLAWELQRSLACLGDVLALDRRSPALPVDLADPDSLRNAVNTVQPHVIVNAGAYTAVDQAEQEETLAFQINGTAPGVLAEAARTIGAALIHYSTDYVFPGDGQSPYAESDPTGPSSVYGRSKLQGELAIAQTGCAHLILRTAWVYGVRGQNFLLTMLRLMRERDSLQVVDDQRGSPSWSRMLAEATALLLARCGNYERLVETSGTYHLTCGGETSWYGFAQTIRAGAIARGLLPPDCARLESIPSSAYPRPARRPSYSVLSNQKLAQAFDIRLPNWENALQLCLSDMATA
jgi:dTDP-4-dehydrorhamnose reductase